MMQRTKPLLFILGMSATLAVAQPEYDLAKLEVAAREQISAARHAVVSAGAFPNPELEYLSGTQRARGPGGNPGNARSVALTQPLDLPWRRSARIAAAEAGLTATGAAVRAFEADTIARLRLHFFDVLRREAELKNAA